MDSSEFTKMNFKKKPKSRAKSWVGTVPTKHWREVEAEKRFHRPPYYLTYMKAMNEDNNS